MLLQELRGQSGTSGSGPMPGTRLAEYELKELTMRGGGVAAFERGDAPPDERELADRVGGLGAHATASVTKKPKYL